MNKMLCHIAGFSVTHDLLLIPHGITCYSLTSVLNFSILFSILSCGSYKEDFSNNEDLLSFSSISFILMILIGE